MAVGISDGLRAAVIGAGPAGAAFAGALLASARAFGRRIDVTLYDGHTERGVEPPAVLDSEARARLASLGAAISARQGVNDVQGVLVYAHGRSALLDPPPGGIWIVDGVSGQPGRETVRQTLIAAATMRGAHVRPWHVGHVERLDGRHVVRAQGASETYDLVAGAFGAGSPLEARWLDGRFRPPPRKIGSHARVSWAGRDDLLRVCFAPTPDVEVLVLVPCGATAYAVAVGNDVAPSGLARALAVLSRDRALPTGLQILGAERVVMNAGAAGRLARGPALALGSAAFGSVLDPGLLPALVSAMRSANAVLELGAEGPLQSRLTHSQVDLASHARRQPRILRWARRAGDRTPRVLAQVASLEQVPASPGLGLLGLPNLTPQIVQSKLRLEAVKRSIAETFAPVPEPYPEPPTTQPLVFVVDDDPDARSALSEYLGARGAIVRAFGDEMALLEAATRERPAAILLDVVLRWVDGFSLCRALRAHPSTARIRLISMSGLNRPADRKAATAAGADAFLPKPVNFEELDKLLGDVVTPPQPVRQQEALAQARG